jgi:hypothetical protein
MRVRFLLVSAAILSGCSGPGAEAPSLAPRPAEAIDPRVPVPDPVLRSTPDPQLVDHLGALLAAARAGDSAFQPAAETASRLASAAGAAESESWVLAQQALSVAIAARAPVARAAGDVDSLAARRVKEFGGIGAADLRAIQAASQEIGDIDRSEAARVSEIQAQLRR